MQKITPFLWFDDNAEEAMNFYLSVFKNSKEIRVSRYPEGGPAPAGSVMIADYIFDNSVNNKWNPAPEKDRRNPMTVCDRTPACRHRNRSPSATSVHGWGGWPSSKTRC